MVKKLYPDHTANQELGMELRSWALGTVVEVEGRMEASMLADRHEGHAFIHSLTRPLLSAWWVLEITGMTEADVVS